MNVLHIACNEGLSAVYPSQVLRPMSLVGARTGARIRLVVASPVGELLRRPARLAWRARKALAEQAFGLTVARMPAAPSRLRGLASERVVACRWLRALIAPGEPVILHCRGRAAAELGLAVRALRPAARIVFDCRGWEGPELLHAGGFLSEDGAPPDLLARSREIEARQRAAALAADAVIVVSDAMRQVAADRWGVEEHRLSVVPCCADTDDRAGALREATRARLRFEGRFVVVYCGSLARYQAIDASLDLFETIRERRGDALFFGITPSPAGLAAVLRRRGVPERHCRVASAPHTEVPALLAAADLALLLRERSKVSEVASPVKLAEYLAAGLPILISEGIGDYSELVRREGLGCVLPAAPMPPADAVLERFLEGYGASAAAMRLRCRGVAERQLSAERAAQILGELYRMLWRDLTGAERGGRSLLPAHRAAA